LDHHPNYILGKIIQMFQHVSTILTVVYRISQAPTWQIVAGAAERRCALKILHRRQYLAQVAEGLVVGSVCSKLHGENRGKSCVGVCFFRFRLRFWGSSQFVVAWGLNLD
jgi:hypothetical protein